MRSFAWLRPLCAAVVACSVSGCGLDFAIADQDKDKTQPEVEDDVSLPATPLRLATEADPRAYNELIVQDVAKVQAVFEHAPEANQEITLWVRKFEPKDCGNLESVVPEFRWVELDKDGMSVSTTVVQPQRGQNLEAGKKYRLEVEMSTSLGRCRVIQLRFEAVAQVL